MKATNLTRDSFAIAPFDIHLDGSAGLNPPSLAAARPRFKNRGYPTFKQNAPGPRDDSLGAARGLAPPSNDCGQPRFFDNPHRVRSRRANPIGLRTSRAERTQQSIAPNEPNDVCHWLCQCAPIRRDGALAKPVAPRWEHRLRRTNPMTIAPNEPNGAVSPPRRTNPMPRAPSEPIVRKLLSERKFRGLGFVRSDDWRGADGPQRGAFGVASASMALRVRRASAASRREKFGFRARARLRKSRALI